MLKWFTSIRFEGEGAAAGGGASGGSSAGSSAGSGTASTDSGNQRVADLRAELAAERVARKDVADKLVVAQTELASHKTEVDSKVQTEVGKVTAKLTKLQEKLINAELRAKAKELGLKDVDLLLHPLLDRTKIKLGDDDEVTGIKEAFDDLKVKKPEWFETTATSAGTSGATGGTGGGTTTPPVKTGAAAPPAAGGTGGASAIDVRKMTPEQYTAHKKALMRDLRTTAH